MASIACRKFGLHKNIAFVWAKTLEEAKYKLRTMLGLSEESYSHCVTFPIYGTGQGSGNSPVVWYFLSSILFESPNKKSSIQLFMIGFVDDSNDQVNIFTADHPPTPETLITMVRHDAQFWSDLLWASVGALELSQCTYHFLYFDITPTGEQCTQPGQVGPPLTILSGD
jgi:hypothetical protein